MTDRRHHKLGVRVPHYLALTVIGVLALFPMYFMAVTGLKNGIQLEKNPFNARDSPSVRDLLRHRLGLHRW